MQNNKQTNELGDMEYMDNHEEPFKEDVVDAKINIVPHKQGDGEMHPSKKQHHHNLHQIDHQPSQRPQSHQRHESSQRQTEQRRRQQQHTAPRPEPVLQIRTMELERFVNDPRLAAAQYTQKRRVPVLRISRKSQLVALILVVAQYAAVDMYNMLPLGLILYSIGLKLAVHELWNVSWQDEDGLQMQQQAAAATRQRQHRHQQLAYERELQAQYQRAVFEYHVLQNRPHIRIIQHVDEHTGQTVLYAV